jgi:hypothetical protein
MGQVDSLIDKWRMLIAACGILLHQLPGKTESRTIRIDRLTEPTPAGWPVPQPIVNREGEEKFLTD